MTPGSRCSTGPPRLACSPPTGTAITRCTPPYPGTCGAYSQSTTGRRTARRPHAIRAWTTAIRDLGDYYHDHYGAGHADVIGNLEAEEANLLRARQLAIEHHWPELVIGPMQGLRALYQHTGRAIEWRRLVAELTPVFTDPATGGPRPRPRRRLGHLR